MNRGITGLPPRNLELDKQNWVKVAKLGYNNNLNQLLVDMHEQHIVYKEMRYAKLITMLEYDIMLIEQLLKEKEDATSLQTIQS